LSYLYTLVLVIAIGVSSWAMFSPTWGYWWLELVSQLN
jgi:hypothetical protein